MRLITEFNIFNGDKQPYQVPAEFTTKANHAAYTKILNETQFFEMYKENCNEVSLKDLYITRGIQHSSTFLYINTDLHKGNHYGWGYELLYVIMDRNPNWEVYPQKGKSLDIGIRSSQGSGSYGREYYVIPFNGAKIVLMRQLISGSWPYIANRFKTATGAGVGNAGNGLCQAIINIWKNLPHTNFKETYAASQFNPAHSNAYDHYFITHYEECMKEVEEQGNTKLVQIIKQDMEFLDMGFIQCFEHYLDPYNNEMVLCSYDEGKEISKPNPNEKTPTKYYGWTDSKVLMIDKYYFDKNLKGKV